MAVAQAQIETLFGTTFTGTPKGPYYGVGDVVWRKSEFSSSLSTWDKAKKYTVVDIQLKTFDDSGTERFADSTGVEVTNAGSQPTDTTSGWFYQIKNVGSNAVTSYVHESDLLDESAMETYLATQVAGFIG